MYRNRNIQKKKLNAFVLMIYNHLNVTIRKCIHKKTL
jgi:hypothetical protein